MRNPSEEEIERFRKSGIFDHGYYLQNYREELPEGIAPFTHFITEGMHRGFKPSAGFDPLLYKVRHPEADNSLIDVLDRYQGMPTGLDARTTLPVSKTASYLPSIPLEIDKTSDNAANIAYAARFGGAAAVKFEAGAKTFELLAPAAHSLIGRIQNDQPFSFVRLSHGDWDCLYVLAQYRHRIAAALSHFDFNNEQLDALARRLCDELYPDRGVYAENVLPEILRTLGDYKENPNFMYSVCFKGFPTADERLFYLTKSLHPVDQARLDIFADHFNADDVIYDSTIWKRWLISGDMRNFPDILRDHPVVFVGANRLSSLGKRWNLPWFFHIPIPPEQAYPLRHALLATCREKIAEAKRLALTNNTKRPIFLCQGSSFAYWLIARLFKTDPDVFYIDLGQALHAWFWDVAEIPLMQWGELYGRTIVKNCGLENYYRDIGARLPPKLLQG